MLLLAVVHRGGVGVLADEAEGGIDDCPPCPKVPVMPLAFSAL